MKHLDVQSSTYIDCGVGNNEKDSKFEVVDPVRRLKYENILGKCFTPNCYAEIFVIKKVKNIKPWAYVIENLNGEEFVWAFKKKWKRQIKQSLTLKK